MKCFIAGQDQERIVLVTAADVNYEHRDVRARAPRDGRFLTIHKRRKKRLVTCSLVEHTALLDDLLMGQTQVSKPSTVIIWLGLKYCKVLLYERANATTYLNVICLYSWSVHTQYLYVYSCDILWIRLCVSNSQNKDT